MEHDSGTPEQQPPPPPPPPPSSSSQSQSQLESQPQTPPPSSYDTTTTTTTAKGASVAETEPTSPLSLGSAPSSQQNISGSTTTVAGADSSLVTPSTSSWSAESDRQLGHGFQRASPDPSDRVFPIRSVVSVDPGSRAPSQVEYFPRMSYTGPTAAPSSSGTSRPQPRVDTDPAPSAGIISAGATRAARKESISQTASTPDSISAMSPTSSSRRTSRQGPTSGPYSSVQADAARQGKALHIPLFSSSDNASNKLDDEEGSRGAGGASPASGRPPSLGDVPDPCTFTTRFSHVETEDGHAVITGHDGVMQRCEDEPIHTPGAVQGFGVILTLHEVESGQFMVRHVSENSERILGYSPQKLFKLPNFLDIFSDEQQDSIVDHIDFVRDEDADVGVNGPKVFSLQVKPPGRRTIKLWCAMHINPIHADLIICEFELEDDAQFPLCPPEDATPSVPEDTLHSNPTLEELTESTEILSKPLRVLRSARKQRGEAGAMQVFDIMSQVQEQLSRAPSLEVFLKILVGIVKELTGFHRVMVYQFDAHYNGKVVTELVDASQTVDLYKGLHFPASDIPKQARELYKLNKVRLLYDRDQETARLICRSKEVAQVPLDMSHGYLRAISPIHLKYLANMAVRASMSVSINAFNELWGLIACHSYGPHGMRVSFPIRKMCRLVGDTASRNIERLSYASRLQARKLINTQPTDKNPSGYIIASSDDLLKLFDADFGLLSIQGETKIMGNVEHSQEALAMLEYLRMRKLTSVTVVHDIREEFADLRYPPGFSIMAGILYVPLSAGGHDFIVFCRKGQTREVKWAGNPYEKKVRQGTANYLEPRTSFSMWRETVLGRCREWSDEHVETAAVLCLVYGKFIQVWRQKEEALQNSRLTRLLLANSAHEVRTPLNAIINYLEIALEGSLDQETRDNLARSHSASKSLIYVINDLLDLTKTEEGQNLIEDEIFDLPACIREAAEPLMADAKRKGIKYDIFAHPGLPRAVYGDNRRVRQAVSNICANAIQHTTEGFVKVECYVTEVQERRVLVEIAVADSGDGMKAETLDSLFRDLEQVEQAADDAPADQPEGRVLGLGLAMVARIVRNMDGQLRLRSEEGKGSRFVMQLPFELLPDSPDAPDESPMAAAPSTTGSSVASVSTALAPPPLGEITLVSRQSSSSMPTIAELSGEKKGGDAASMKSQRTGSSSKSDADRLISAIQTPLGYDNPDVDESSRPVSSPTVGRRDRRSMSPASIAQWRDRTSPSAVDRAGPERMNLSQPAAETGGRRRSKIRAVKVPDDYFDMQPNAQPKAAVAAAENVGYYPDLPLPSVSATRTESNMSSSANMSTSNTVESGSTVMMTATRLQVLIAEDDPINLKILQKRLEKAGYDTHHAVNGEVCATVYRENSTSFDVVLMDMQMPMVDGLTSTKMIRAWERDPDHMGYSALAAPNGRIPIFAVSASLVEKDRRVYIDAGFDGWILKPVDFKRLNTLLQGITDEQVRASCLYEKGQWERGGWFRRASLPSSMPSSDTEDVTTVDDDDNDNDGNQDETPTGA